jgi:hypothetical protein
MHTAASCRPHIVCKFFDDYRALCDELATLGVGKDKKIPLTASFPPTYSTSTLGIQLTTSQLQYRLVDDLIPF